MRSEIVVASGGVNPIHSNDVGSIWLNAQESGIRKRKVAMRLCIIGNQELPCPLK